MIQLWVNQTTISDDGWTALHLACKDSEDHSIFMYLLKDLKANLYIRNKKGVSLMHMAAISDNTYLLTYLRDKGGASVLETDMKGNTPLHYACNRGAEWSAYWLIGFGANVNALNNRKDTPMHMIINKPEQIFSTKTVRELIFRGGNKHAENIDGKIPADYIDTIKEENLKNELIKVLGP